MNKKAKNLSKKLINNKYSKTYMYVDESGPSEGKD